MMPFWIDFYKTFLSTTKTFSPAKPKMEDTRLKNKADLELIPDWVKQSRIIKNEEV